MYIEKEFYKSPLTSKRLKSAISELSLSSKGVRAFYIGESVLKKQIHAISIGNINTATIFVSAVHAQEWITALLTMKFFENLAYHYDLGIDFMGTDLSALDDNGIVLIPMLNPDGVDIAINGVSSGEQFSGLISEAMRRDARSWQANARGVDLNHNFDAGFYLLRQMEITKGIDAPSPRQYGGKTPHSEPETKALTDFCESADFARAVAFHSQGEEIYYKYGGNTPSSAKFIGQMLAASSNYKLCEPTGLASHGGFKDWFIERYRRPAFTIEIGRGTNPLPISALDGIYNRVAKAMLTSIIL